MTDVVLNKLQTIRRCLERIDTEYAGEPLNLENITRQDAVILNVQRACEACISLAMHIVSRRNLGIPQNSREAFALLSQAGIISDDLAQRLKAMVGFRNIAIHDYQSLNVKILQTIIEKHLGDFREFSEIIISLPQPD